MHGGGGGGGSWTLVPLLGFSEEKKMLQPWPDFSQLWIIISDISACHFFSGGWGWGNACY